MRYETPLFLWGFLGHVMAVVEVPTLRALPLPVQAGLVVVPTAMLLVDFFTAYREREGFPAKVGAALATVAGALHVGMSLALPLAILLRVFQKDVSVPSVLAALFFPLLILTPTLWFGGTYLLGALESWREEPPPAPAPAPTDAP